MKEKNIITFSPELKKEILDIFDKTVDEEGYIVEKGNPSEKVLTPDGEELKLKNFAGVTKGSLMFVKSDLVSLIKLHDKI